MNSNVKTRNTGFAACFLTILACTLFSSVFAGERVRSETVEFQDVTVGTPAGVEVLYQRIHSAAQRVCSVSGERDLARVMSSASCAKEAEAGAIIAQQRLWRHREHLYEVKPSTRTPDNSLMRQGGCSRLPGVAPF